MWVACADAARLPKISSVMAVAITAKIKCLDLFMLTPLLLCNDANTTFSMIDEMYYGIGVPVGVPNRTTQGNAPGFSSL